LKDAICYHANCSQLLHDEQSGSVAWGLCEVERVAKVECYQLEGRSLRHHNRSCAPAPAKACNDRGRAWCDRCNLSCTVAGAGYGGDGGIEDCPHHAIRDRVAACIRNACREC